MATDLATFGTIEGELEQQGFAVRTHEQLPEWLYHIRPEWSKSQFALLPDEPEMFHGRHILILPDYQLEESPQMRLGTAVHEAVLLDQDVKVIPADALTSNGQRRGKAWEDFELAHPHETWLREAESEPAKRAVEAVRKRKYAMQLLSGEGENELSIFWVDEITNLKLRGRLDRFRHGGNGIIVDLKTSNDPMPDGFKWKCLDFQYHVQAATYMYGATQCFTVTPDAFCFIVVEVQPPYRCRVYEADDEELIAPGYIRMQEALADLKYRLESDNWETPDADAVHTLRLPKKKTY